MTLLSAPGDTWGIGGPQFLYAFLALFLLFILAAVGLRSAARAASTGAGRPPTPSQPAPSQSAPPGSNPLPSGANPVPSGTSAVPPAAPSTSTPAPNVVPTQ